MNLILCLEIEQKYNGHWQVIVWDEPFLKRFGSGTGSTLESALKHTATLVQEVVGAEAVRKAEDLDERRAGCG